MNRRDVLLPNRLRITVSARIRTSRYGRSETACRTGPDSPAKWQIPFRIR